MREVRSFLEALLEIRQVNPLCHRGKGRKQSSVSWVLALGWPPCWVFPPLPSEAQDALLASGEGLYWPLEGRNFASENASGT